MEQQTIHIETPLIYSSKFSKLVGVDVYLKLESNQPSGSFKLRGNGYHCQKEVERGCKRLITASGGNTGLAVATAGRALGVPVSVFIPTTSPKLIIAKLEELGADVEIHGKDFGEANDRAVEEGKKPGCSYIHPYTHPETWEGHSTMVDEVASQLPAGQQPGCFVVSVGGGGLLQGVLRGLEKHGWSDIPVVAVETQGADCFDKALKAGGKSVDLDQITSIAVTLGARAALQALLDCLPKFHVENHVVPDVKALESCIQFADDHRILVEPACGAALSAVYFGMLKELVNLSPLQGPIVVVVCGGSGVSLDLLRTWAEKFQINFPL